MLGLYAKYVVPRLLNKSMGPLEFNQIRQKTVVPAEGVVLEIGFGSGYNIPFYTTVTEVYALDPSRELFTYATERIKAAPFPVTYLQNSAESIPLPDNSIDTVVSTWSMCSIPNLQKALSEIRRVLKPGGILLFVEHGRSPNKLYGILQKIITPITRHFTGNCHLDREIDIEIKNAGFTITQIETSPEEGRPLMFSYGGVAVKS